MEFGSDFHYVENYPQGYSLFNLLPNYRLYTTGRQALEAIVLQENIKRIWFPSYYCHESIVGIRKLGIEIKFYPCTPLCNQDRVIENLCLGHNEALVRMNYFGFHIKPKTPCGQFILIEDHSHNPISSWAMMSEADWCFASLRKTLPIADGGILWSPRKREMPEIPLSSEIACINTDRRYAAMKLKADYLTGKNIIKSSFLEEFHFTELRFDSLPISLISENSNKILSSLDINLWNDRKKNNWDTLYKSLIHKRSYRILKPESSAAIPFSMILLFDNFLFREKVRRELIDNKIYPAILWNIPVGNDPESVSFGKRMLSIHCDGRYCPEQMIELSTKINHIIKQ